MEKTILFNFLLLTAFFLLVFGCEKEENFDNENFNEIVVGQWQINDSEETIEFFEEGFFILNDDIFGNYWVSEDNIREIAYICDGEETASKMRLVRYVGGQNSIVVDNLPKHKGETQLTRIKN